MRFSKEIKQLIKSTKIINFPIGLPEIKQIIERSGWEIYSYKDASEIIDSCGLREMAEKNDSFASQLGGRIIIFYDDNISQLDFPHILAHEIGHIVLGHLSDLDDIYSKERDCECFAEELLGYIPRYKPFAVGTITVGLIALTVGITGILSKTDDNLSDIQTEVSTSVPNIIVSDSIIISDIVYVTQYGKKYHLAGCRYINGKDNLLEISIEQAEQGGYEPCEICFGE